MPRKTGKIQSNKTVLLVVEGETEQIYFSEGLRLPVDENGNRISNEQFMLNYIVDFTEADFADKLVAGINSERPAEYALTVSEIAQVAEKRGNSGYL